MESVKRFVTHKLRLKVNEAKSAVGRPWERKFLGFSFTNSRANPLIRVHWKTIQRFKQKVRELTRRTCGHSLQRVINELGSYFRGWWGYFGIAESVNRLRPLAHWVRRRLRSLVWKQWKNRRTRVANLLKGGVSRTYAVTTGCARKGPWWMSRVKWVTLALPDEYFHSRGLLVPWLDPA